MLETRSYALTMARVTPVHTHYVPVSKQHIYSRIANCGP